MNQMDAYNLTLDPIELLNETLQCAWRTICQPFDVSSSMPEMQTLFCDADLTEPADAARTVLINILGEVMECVSRFSPWYKMPARAYGLVSLRDPVTHKVRWLLAPEAIEKWEHLLKPLEAAITRSSGLIKAMLLVNSLMDEKECEKGSIIIRCGCTPPRKLVVTRKMVENTTLICDRCCHSFEQ